MIWWATIAGVLLGFSQFDFGGIVTGGLLGAAMGAWLKHVVQEAITREVDRRMAGLELSARDPERAPTAAPLAPSSQRSGSPWTQSAAPKVAEAEATVPRRKPAETPAAQVVAPAAPTPSAAPTLPVGELFAKAQGWLLGGNTIVRVGLVILFVGLTFLRAVDI